jgi:uncharacterized membrane protein
MAFDQAKANVVRRWLSRAPARLAPAEQRVLESARQHTTIAADTNAQFEREASLGDRVADRIAAVGGSWSFIVGFLIFLVAWVVLNTVLLSREAPDPYPFIFLNLVLSMLAALQAPIIMMSQNRASDRDRIEARHDYEVNLKSEIEILALHEKLDALRAAELARIAVLLEDVTARLERIEAGPKAS